MADGMENKEGISMFSTSLPSGFTFDVVHGYVVTGADEWRIDGDILYFDIREVGDLTVHIDGRRVGPREDLREGEFPGPIQVGALSDNPVVWGAGGLALGYTGAGMLEEQ